MKQILLSVILVSPPKKGIVITTIQTNMSDSCRTTIKLEDNNKDTIVFFPKNKCPNIRDVIYLK